MKKKFIRITITLLLVSLVVIACTPGVEEEQLPDELESIGKTQTQDEVSQPEESPEPSRFTIYADNSLREPVTALYSAYFQGEAPNFIENEDNADLIATSAPPLMLNRPEIQATFLPDAVFIPENEAEDLLNFIDFAISADGQQVLIESGDLPDTITLTDQAGNDRVIMQPVRRVISAFGPASAVVYSVNAGERLVAASFLGARDPQGAAAMEGIDPRFQDLISDDYFSQHEFNLEYAATLNPDLVIAGARSPWADTVSELGIEVFLMEAETPEQLKEAVLLIGQIFGPHSFAQAQAWVTYYEWIVETILVDIQKNPQDERPSVLFTGTEPLRIASSEMYQTNIIESAGGISVSTELRSYWNDVNMEQIAIWNPEVIIVPPYGGASVEAITESSEWQIIEAVQEDRVYRMPKLVVPWDTPAPDSVLGIVWMAERLHPDLIDLNCAEESEFFYNTFYQYAITGEEIAAICDLE